MTELREFQETDLPQIKALLQKHRADFDPPFSDKTIEIETQQILQYKTAIVAVNENGKIVGYVRYGHSALRIPLLKQIEKENRRKQQKGEQSQGKYQGELRHHKRHGYIFTILIAKEARGLGLGTRLVKAAETKIKRMRYKNRKPIRSILMTRHEGNLGTAKIAERLKYNEFGRAQSPFRQKHTQTIVYGKIIPKKK